MFRFWANGGDQFVARLSRQILLLRWRRFFSRDPALISELRELEARYADELKQQRYNLHLEI